MGKSIIKIACKGSRMAKLADLEIIQGDLKELSEENYAKLRKRIETKGFDAPFFVWQDIILDGTQRKRVLGKMISDGWLLAKGEVPVCDILADSLEDAKDRLLGYVSQYGKLTDDGLYEFLNSMEVSDLETIDFPDFDLDAFKSGFLEEGGHEKEGDGEVSIPDKQNSIIIDCVDEIEQKKLFERFKAEGLTCRLLTL